MLSDQTYSQSNLNLLIERQEQIISRLQILESFIGCNRICPLTYSRPLLSNGPGPLNTFSRNTFQHAINDLDEISKVIIQIIAVSSALNITNITRKVKAKRGKASRRIVRQKINRLVKLGFVVKADGRIPTYKLVTESIQSGHM